MTGGGATGDGIVGAPVAAAKRGALSVSTPIISPARVRAAFAARSTGEWIGTEWQRKRNYG